MRRRNFITLLGGRSGGLAGAASNRREVRHATRLRSDCRPGSEDEIRRLQVWLCRRRIHEDFEIPNAITVEIGGDEEAGCHKLPIVSEASEDRIDLTGRSGAPKPI